MLKTYLKKLTEIAGHGDAREESFYSALSDLLHSYAESSGRKKTRVTTLPKTTEAGNPDFRIWDGTQHIVGYAEAKAPTVEHLDQIESTNQLKRYRHTFPNLLLTNFFEFRLYRNGALIDRVQIARPFMVHEFRRVPPVENEPEFMSLLEKFFSFSFPKVYSAKTLAIELAKRTRFLKDEVITRELEEEEHNGKGDISGFYEAFTHYLISGLSKEEFADLYSQTITYGLFAARTRARNGFNRKLAYDSIPPTIGILRDVFKFISLGDLPPQMEWIIDDISDVLAVTDVYKLLDEYFHQHKGKDPIVHFYETFLAEYDPKMREKRGVYYTPEPVVSYIVRSLNEILKEHFDRSDGLGDSNVTVLDPAAGTLTFLAEAAKLAVEEFVGKYGEGTRQDFIKERVLDSYYAFELMMAPYAVGHLKMSFLLEELGYKLKQEDRFKLYLTNTLEMEELPETQLPGMASLSKESHLAAKVKKEEPILVIIGNPPYSGHSANVGEWISKEIKAYYQVDGKPLDEKNPKWLQDDYVKFIRFAQWKIEQSGGGVVGFITNHSYLDNPTFRGMRQSLMNSFDAIYILDLHGSTLRKEKCPDGSRDENVFDIQQGVAITLFVKQQEKEESTYPWTKPSPQMDLFEEEQLEEEVEEHKCAVYHSEIWGLRQGKYGWLLNHSITNTKWQELEPKSGFYLFVPRDEKLLMAYESNPRVNEILPVNSVGIVTARDNLTIRWTRDEMWTTVLSFSKMDTELTASAFGLGPDTEEWRASLAQKDLIESGIEKDRISRILCKPFDVRYTYYTGRSRGFHSRPRPEVMSQMQKENVALCFMRQVSLGEAYTHFFVSDCMINNRMFLSSKGYTQLAPLYLYKEKENPKRRPSIGTMMLFEEEAEYGSRKPNLSPTIVDELTKTYSKAPPPEEIFFYIYAVLYSNIYRTRYTEFLKIDFPRIPFTKDHSLFSKMAKHGQRLVSLHLLKSKDLDSAVNRLEGEGDNRIEKPTYDDKTKRIYINKTRYFENIPKDVWDCQIGGYQVCAKWLKDRKGRKLSLDDIKHYCRIVTALQKTLKIQQEIDKLYPEVESETIDFGKEQ